MKISFFIKMFIVVFMAENAMALSDDLRPDYQKEYEAYLHDLQILEQKGYAPQNSVLEDDLAKMSSERRIRLTPSVSESQQRKSHDKSSGLARKVFDKGGILKLAQNNVNRLNNISDAEIVNQVEIIRVPEEFREQYADVYAEETRRISAKDILKQQEENQQKILDDEEALKIADHKNPFRLLKESEFDTEEVVESQKSDRDLLTNAYFQHNRAYVTGKPIIVKKKEPAVVSRSSSSIQSSRPAVSSVSGRPITTTTATTSTSVPSSLRNSKAYRPLKGLGASMFIR